MTPDHSAANATRVSASWIETISEDAPLATSAPEDKILEDKTSIDELSAVFAGKGGFVIGNKRTSGGSRILFQIRSIVRKKGDTVIKSVPVFAVKRNRQVNPAATHFMQRSSLKSAGGMNDNFVMNAKKQLAKIR